MVPQQPKLSIVGQDRVETIRRFNRFYTRELGVLEPRHLNTDFSLTEVRVLYELAHWSETGSESATATEVGRKLGLDAGYLSRLLGALARRRLVKRMTSREDGRRHELQLTATGRSVVAGLEQRARESVAAMLAPLSDREQRNVIDALRTVQASLDPGTESQAAVAKPAFALRSRRPGDLGWVVERHGALYASEYGWDERFEALVARIVADYVEHLDRECETCWIADREGENVGCVFLVRHPERSGVAKLRLLLVEPSARGLGIGRRLVAECSRFARSAGYHTITLWTNSVLTSAIRIYEGAGYQKVEEAPHHSFGHDLVSQTWELAL